MSHLSPLSRDVKRVALALGNGLAGSMWTDLKKVITNDLWDDLVNFDVHPSSYTDPEEYFKDAASVAFLKKYQGLPTTIDKKARALSNFWSAECTCFRTNQRLYPFVFGTFTDQDLALSEFFSDLRKEVVLLIGERPPANPQGRFGPGSTYSDRGGLTTVLDKMQTQPELTRDAWPFLVPWSGTPWCSAAASRGDQVCFRRGNRFTTVPKNGKTDRGISIEPSLNIFYQLAYGTAMRESLKKNTAHRVVLESMQEIHRQVAREASLTGAFATLDLAQASDTLSSALVRLALPDPWFIPLNDLRSPTTTLSEGGVEKTVVLEKFSSMGNGYTFELETVVFMALCCTVMRRNGLTPKPGINVYVYGDDIIVPTEIVRELTAALSFCGLTLNKEKSFSTGPFRESCGGDFFGGVSVRPFSLKEEVDEPQHFISMVNGIRRMACENRLPYYRWSRVRNAWFAGLDSIPSHIRRCRGPEALGDICIHDEPVSWATKRRNSIRYIQVYKPATYREIKWSVFDEDVQLAGAVYGVGSEFSAKAGAHKHNNGVLRPRDGVTGYKLGWVTFS